MICLCGKNMIKHKQNVEISVSYPSGNYGTEYEEQKGFLCNCGLFLGETVAVFKNKSYPYWKYDSDQIKNIMMDKEIKGIKE